MARWRTGATQQRPDGEAVLMTSLVFIVIAVVAAEQGARGAADEQAGFHQFQGQISELLKREAQAQDQAVRAAAIREMCGLHQQIVGDERYATSDKLKEYRARLWSRLTKIKAELKQQLARDAKERQALDDVAVLERADAASLAAADSLMATLALADQAQGGPGYLLGYGGGAVADNGRALVELIERTINPAFWDVNGGPGSIVYYAPLQCLVVRATGEIHGNVGGLIGGLRDAGR
jgi:hypothetical protein